MNKEELLELIHSLKISPSEFFILSSGALVMRGILPDAGDLDIAVTEKGLEELKQNYSLQYKENNWFIVNEKVEGVVSSKEENQVEECDGVLLQGIEKYYQHLLKSEREKDKVRIPLVEEYIKNHQK